MNVKDNMNYIKWLIVVCAPLMLFRCGSTEVIVHKKYIPPEHVKTEVPKAKNRSSNKTDNAPPRIKITLPNISSGVKAVKTKRLTVEGMATDRSGIAEVLVNGRDAKIDRDGNFVAHTLLKIGQNEIMVSAMDTFGNRSEMSFGISREKQFKRDRIAAKELLPNWYHKQYAVVIGIDRYQNLEIPGLQNAVGDGRAVAGMFRDMGFEVVEIYNEDASKANIRDTLRKIEKVLLLQDAFLFYFAGHGQAVDLKNNDRTGYIIPYDFPADLQSKGIIDYEENAISLEYLSKISKAFKAKHIVLLFDSCFSGLAFNKRSIRPRSKFNTEYYEDILNRRTINVLTAGDDQPVSDGTGHSPFTNALLMALKGKGADIIDHDGFVTFGQLAVYVKENVEKRTQRKQRPQFDNIITDDGDFIFDVRQKLSNN